jgi:hypothetical protein
VEARLSVAEAGAHAVHDAVALPDGRLLVALGEAGVRLLRVDGGCVAHFDVPAFALALSAHGSRAVALAPRGELQRLSRLDLSALGARPWGDMRVDAFAPAYDGLWFVAEGSTVLAVDTLAGDGWRALWRVPGVGQRVLAMAADAERMSFVSRKDAREYEVWTYTLAGGPTLRARKSLTAEEPPRQVVLTPEGTAELLAVPAVALAPPWRVVVTPTPEGHEARLVSSTGTPRAKFLFEGEAPVRARFSGGWLLLFDALGRLVRVDLAEGVVRRVPLH